MANIHETISEVEKLNPDLARQLRKYVKEHSYGLVFEHNLPEAVRLWKKDPGKGDVVNILPPRGQFDKAENSVPWVVKDIKNGVASLQHDNETKDVPVEDIVVVVSYRDVIYPGLKEIDRIENGNPDDPYHVVINAENYHALEALVYAYAGKVDCIYIDPPYNTGAKDWKYNNDYVGSDDQYRHSKWLAFIERRLKLAKQLLNPKDSVLIVTIDEKEYLRLGMLLEQMFPEAKIQMVSSVINRAGTNRKNEFSRTDEYIYFVMFGKCVVLPELDMSSERISIVWDTLRRSNPNNTRDKTNTQFYPIYVNDKDRVIDSIGEPLDINVDITTIVPPIGCTAVFPIRDNGMEMMWGCKREELLDRLSKGYVKVGKYTPNKPQKYIISYLTSGIISDIESGKVCVQGKDKYGGVIGFYDGNKSKPPTTNWQRESHDAQWYGSIINRSLLPDRTFPYPKSLYAVEDCLRFFVADKPDALIVDFFAGSGTTVHATMLINHLDNGHRKCICVTNNDVGGNAEKKYTKKGLRPSDPDWEKYGIANYCTWPRIKAAITGINTKGDPIEGDYKFTEEFPMSDGFKENAIFCELTYESAWPIRLDNAFDAIAPILWMLAGCRGPIIRRIGKSYLTTDYYGVLFDYAQASKFCETVKKKNLNTAFVVTDDQRRFSNICRRLPGVDVHRLYETYLRTFEICGEGGLD